jgi:hypothetical protein
MRLYVAGLLNTAERHLQSKEYLKQLKAILAHAESKGNIDEVPGTKPLFLAFINEMGEYILK